MDSINGYLNLMESINLGWIIGVIIAMIVFTIIIGIIRYYANIKIIKKCVKDAIKELNAEVVIKNKESTKKEEASIDTIEL